MLDFLFPTHKAKFEVRLTDGSVYTVKRFLKTFNVSREEVESAVKHKLEFEHGWRIESIKMVDFV